MNSKNDWDLFISNYIKEKCKVYASEGLPDSIEYTLEDGKHITLRLEKEKDYRVVEMLTRKAFWKPECMEKLGGIGANEHYLAHTLRTALEFVPELDFIAEFDGKIIGHVIYSIAYVRKPDGNLHAVLSFGPLSVLPEYQKQGVGSALMRHTLKTAARLGYGSVLFFGHPTYYPRFGFKDAKEFGITTSWGDNFPAFMAMELIYGDLDGVTGSFYGSPLFDVDNRLAIEFDRRFQ